MKGSEESQTSQQPLGSNVQTEKHPGPQAKSYSRDDLLPFNILTQPIWVFDIEKKAMWWANTAAVSLWNADSLQSLLARDFSSDMSQGTERRINSYLEGFRKGERVSERCTFYPQGKAVTVNLQLSGITCDGGRLMMLNEGDTPKLKDEIDQMAVRRVEILRHLPLAVAQFDSRGKVMEQNPESMNVFGGSSSSGPGFLSRFVDQSLGQRTLTSILDSGGNQHVDAELHTAQSGPRWFAIKARRSKDPVTSENVILYSARDITEVRQAKKDADQAALEKSEFLAVISHEIRTPLHQVTGFIELLGQTQLTSQQHDYVNFLETSAHCLMTIINELLDYTKLEAGKMKLESIPFEVSDVVAGSLAAIGPKAEKKGLQLKRTLCDKIPSVVVGDPTRLRQLLLNILNNAVKFTDHGEISLSAKLVEGNVNSTATSPGRLVLRFEVRDTGIGISSENQRLIFSKYQQADASTSRKYGGTGLGLAICELIAEAMGGAIGVESTLGEGSVFWFQLPFGRLPSVSRNSIVDLETIPETPPPSLTRKLRVLVCEDNVVNQKLAAALLKRLGHSATIVENGLEAVRAVMGSTVLEYDLCLMDIQMPVLDGLAATRKIREKWSPSELPVIGLTADFRRANLEKYQDVGMNDCIGKPVRLAGLKDIISTVMIGAGGVLNSG